MRFSFTPSKGVRVNVSGSGTSASFSQGGRSVSVSKKDMPVLAVLALLATAALAVVAVAVWLTSAIWNTADDAGSQWLAKVVAAGVTLGVGVGIAVAYFG